MVEIEDDDTKTPCQVILSICHKTNSSSLTLSELMSEFKEVLKAKILWMMILLRPSFIFLSSSLSLHFTTHMKKAVMLFKGSKGAQFLFTAKYQNN
jgi:hypothetical protein